MSKRISQAGLALLKESEGFVDHYYPDQIGQETIGYGHCTKWRGRIRFEPPITREQGEIILREDLVEFENRVNSLAPTLNQHQFDACVDFAFNMGGEAFSDSQIMANIRTGRMDDAANAFLQYNSMGGQYIEGLAVRRKRERAMFLGQ